MKIQSKSHKKPTAPVRIKAYCHPIFSAIHGTVSGVITAPILVPELKIPVANARSFLGNHSLTVLIAAGKLPASLKPNAERAMPNPNELLAMACPIAARLQARIDKA